MVEFNIPKKIDNEDVWSAVAKTVDTFSDYIVKNYEDISEFKKYLKKLDDENISQNRNNSIGDYLKFVYFRNLLSIYNMVANKDFLTHLIVSDNTITPISYVGRNISSNFIDVLKTTNAVDKKETYTFLNLIQTFNKAENFVKSVFTALYKNYMDVVYYEFIQKNPDAEKDKNYENMFLEFIKDYIKKEDEMFNKIFKNIASMLNLMCIVILLDIDIKKYYKKGDKKGDGNSNNNNSNDKEKDSKDSSTPPIDSTKPRDMFVIIDTKNNFKN